MIAAGLVLHYYLRMRHANVFSRVRLCAYLFELLTFESIDLEFHFGMRVHVHNI